MPNPGHSTPSPALQAARRSIERLDYVRITREFYWDETEEKWGLDCVIRVDSPTTALIPKETSWVVLISQNFPSGSIKFYPALIGGITNTFQHQNYNGPFAELAAYRSGGLCLDTTNANLNRSDLDEEPREYDQRLKWHFRRARLWLLNAANGQLVDKDDPFELPEFYGSAKTKSRLVFREDESTFKDWTEISSTCGWFEFFRIFPDEKSRFTSEPLVVRKFLDPEVKTIVKYEWGDVFSTEDKEDKVQFDRGIWFKLPTLPILPPWQAASSWQELESIFKKYGRSLFEELRALGKPLRNGEKLLVAVGFPIGKTFSAAAQRMHWQGIYLPPLARGTSYAPGFRANEQGHWQKDRNTTFSSDKILPWIKSQNWAEEEIRTRGSLPKSLSEANIALLGAGALGSSLAELLVRGGAHSVVVVDSDDTDIGNLSRHILSLVDIGFPKAERLKERLKALSPNVYVDAIKDKFVPSNLVDQDIVRDCDIIIDCTASDSVLAKMAEFEWRGKKHFFSFSFGINVDRVFLYRSSAETFPVEDIKLQLKPWLSEEREKMKDTESPREYTGCWHAIFPARADQVMLASIACLDFVIKNLENERASDLIVLERETASGSMGYRMAKLGKDKND